MKTHHRIGRLALVISLVALFAALSGGAYAAVQIHTSDIANGAVTRPKLSQGVRQQISKAGKRGKTGPQGPRGDLGATGPQGPQGIGVQGTQGVTGAPGANALFTATFAGSSGPDSGDCGNTWAQDTFKATFQVTPQADGTYLVSKLVDGLFTTVAGAHSPNGGCADSIVGGTDGNFAGVETWTVGNVGGKPPEFNPLNATNCGGDCTPNVTSDSAGEIQNRAYMQAVFPGSPYNGVDHFDFRYTATTGDNRGQTWIHSDTAANNSGNITG